MRFIQSLICACAAASTLAASDEDSFIIFRSTPRKSASSKPPSLSPSAARLVLAKQLGLDQYHSLQDVGQDTIDALNSHGGLSQGLLERAQRSYPRTLIYVDGMVATQDFLERFPPAYKVSDPPHPNFSRRLIQDFLLQAKHARSAESACSFDSRGASYLKGGVVGGHTSPLPLCDDPDAQTGEAAQDVRVALSFAAWIFDSAQRLNIADTDDLTTIIHVSVEEILRLVPDKPSFRREVLDIVKEEIFRMFARADEQTTLVMVPSPHAARAGSSTFGTYDVPSLLSRRQVPEEAPLSAVPKAASSKSFLPTSTSSRPLALNTTTPIKTTLPVCHASNRTCFAATNGCSSHGSCTLLYTDRTADTDRKNRKDVECWACACKPSVVRNANGVQTTRWAGSACQKKDISSNFFLLAGLSIGLVAMATWGVGLMYSIGQEELPSVIGAGVAGPRAQK